MSDESVADQVAAQTTASEGTAAQPANADPTLPEAPGEGVAEIVEEKRVGADRIAALARREKRAIEAEQRAQRVSAEAEQRAAAIKAEEAKLRAEVDQARAMQRQLAEARRNPIKFLESVGLSYKDLTESVLNEGKPSPELIARDFEARLEAELEKRLKPISEKFDAIEAEKKRIEEAQADAQYKEALGVLDRNARQFVAANPDRYEAIAAFGEESAISEYIAKEYDRTGQILSYEIAADRIERFLQQQYTVAETDPRGARIRGYFAKRLAPPTPPAPAAPSPTPRRGPAGRTITNKAAAEVPPAPKPSGGREEAMERARLAMARARTK